MNYDGDLPAVAGALDRLRELILRRAVNIDPRAASPEAPTVVDCVIRDFLFSPEYAEQRSALNYHGTASKAMTLLVLQAADALMKTLPAPEPEARPYYRGHAMSRRPDLRVVPANG